MEYFLHIKPTFNCLIKTPTLSTELQKNRLHTFLINKGENLSLSFYPIDEENKNSLPFACQITKHENKLFCHKKEVEIISFPDNNFLMIVNPFLFYYPNSFDSKTQQVSFAGDKHTITYLRNENLFNIQNSFNSLNLTTQETIKEIKTKTKDNTLMCICKTKEDKNFIIGLNYSNKNYEVFCLQNVDILEEESNKITTYTNLKDFAGHGKIVEYNFEENFKENITLVYNYDHPFIAKHKEIIPYAFFEALKVKNYKLARTYLTKDLSNKLTDTHFQKFFGDFLEIHQTLNKNYSPEEISLIYETNNFKFAKIFYLKFDNFNKIENISEQ